MSAATPREAARLMRERAEAATDGPWISRQEHGRDYADEGWSYVAVTSASAEGTPDVAATAYPGDDGLDEAVENSLHIASWHPDVALAVADWLDACAQYLETEPDYTHDGEDYALTVARAYLGDPS